MIEEILTKLGLTDNEAKLYLILLSIGPSHSGAIITKTGFQSSVVYHLLHSLMEKGFVSDVTENKKKIFSAADPSALQRLIDEKESELDEVKKEFKYTLEELNKIKKKDKSEQSVTVYSGIKGIQTIQNDVLNTAKEYLIYSTRNNFTNAMPKYREYFREMRLAKKIRQKVIIADDERKPNRPYQEKRYIPKEFASPVNMQIYNNKVVIFMWDATPPVAVVFEGEKVSTSFRHMFETMWKQAKP